MVKLAQLFHRRKTPEPPDKTQVEAAKRPLPPPAPRPSSSSGVAAAVQERLAQEVLRKLRLATAAEEKEDRDIVCSEVFADITGELSPAARDSTGDLYRWWYEPLALYFCRTSSASEAVLQLCSQLWGQPFAAPVFALLLHQWLLLHPDAGGADQRLKHLNILVSGARQLFLGDVETGNTAFQSLFAFIAERVVLAAPAGGRLDGLPAPAREGVVGLAAAFFPYYCPPGELARALAVFPVPTGEAGGGAVSAGGADFVVDRIVDILGREVRAEAAVIKYLRALTALRDSPGLRVLRTSTRVRLQGELYALTQPGGPRYASRAVNRVAFVALDALFPHGRRTRRAINLAFRFLHPQEWPWMWWDTYGAVMRAAVAWTVAGWLALAAAGGRAWGAVGGRLLGGVDGSGWRERFMRTTR
jgi:hypothetical protein